MNAPVHTRPFLRQVAIAPWVPAWRPRAGLAQTPFVQVTPNVTVQAPVSIELGLGALPLSIGLFAGSGVVFLVKGALPEGWPQTVSIVAGAALAVAGVVNLFLPKGVAPPKAPGGQPGLPPAGPPASAPGTPVQTTQPHFPATIGAFEAVRGRIVKPADFETVDIGPFSNSYPVRVELHNPSTETVTFDLELVGNETPNVGNETISTLPAQVTLGPGQTNSLDFSMPISSWEALVDYVDIILVARKRRGPGNPALLVDTKSFVIE